ncbi:DUF4212 domain-containing protein [Leptothoe sp. LEGE 181152]|nr:DUF4212 domain-containing protein [Leptothoe sp. LEGE 181152]
MRDPAQRHAYWRANITLILALLAVWGFVSLICSILLVDILNQIQFFGLPLGFWIAQQGSILTFVVLIFVYAYQMDKLDKHYRAQQLNKRHASIAEHDVRREHAN